MAKSNGQSIFMTGAAGYVGSRITAFALAAGYTVHGLSRSPKSDAKLEALGAVPVRGDLGSVEVLRRESAAADVVIHLADAWIDHRDDYAAVVRVDNAAVDAMASGLGPASRKPLIVTSGTLVAERDPSGGETDESAPPRANSFNDRIACEQHALGLSARGLNVCAIRLAPYVYGRGGSGVKLFMGLFAGLGEAVYVGEGAGRTTGVHVDDAARLYLLVIEKAGTGAWAPGEVFNATAGAGVTVRELVEAMAGELGIPARSLSLEEMAKKCGDMVAGFMSMEDSAGSAKAVKVLGWKARELGILDEIKNGSYQAVVKELREGAVKN